MDHHDHPGGPDEIIVLTEADAVGWQPERASPLLWQARLTWIIGVLAGAAAYVLLAIGLAAVAKQCDAPLWPTGLVGFLTLMAGVWALVALVAGHQRRGVRGHAVAGLIVNILAMLFCGLSVMVLLAAPGIKAEARRQQAAGGARTQVPGRRTQAPRPAWTTVKTPIVDKTPAPREASSKPEFPPVPAGEETELARRETVRFLEQQARLQALRQRGQEGLIEVRYPTQRLDTELLDLGTPEETSEALVQRETTENGIRIAELKLPFQVTILGGDTWSADGKRLFLLPLRQSRPGQPQGRAAIPPTKTLQSAGRADAAPMLPAVRLSHELIEISLPDWIVRRRLAVPSGKLAVSKDGLLLLGAERLMVIDPVTLKVKRVLRVPDREISASPLGSLALLSGRGRLSLIDLSEGGQVTDLQLMYDVDSSPALLTPTGRCILCLGPTRLHCIGVEADALTFKEESVAIARRYGDRLPLIGPDSKYMLVPARVRMTSGQSDGSGFYRYETADLKKPPSIVRLIAGPAEEAVPGDPGAARRRPSSLHDVLSNEVTMDPMTGHLYTHDFQHYLVVFGPDGRFEAGYLQHRYPHPRRMLVHPHGRKLLIIALEKSYWVDLSTASVEAKPHE